MKRITYIIGLMFLFSSCENWLDVNIDADVPTKVPGEMLLPSAQVGLATCLGGELFNTGGFFAQYWTQAPEAQQYKAIDVYDIKNPYLNSIYTILFAGVLEDCKLICEDAAENENWGLNLMATVIRVYTYQLLIDMVDQIPYTEALQAEKITAPKWDSGEEVYNSLLGELESALEKFAAMSKPIRTEYDMIYASDFNEWVRFANSLKLKLLMRESLKTDRNKAKLEQLIKEDQFITSDVKLSCWGNETGKQNPWYSTNKTGLKTQNHVGGFAMITFFSRNSDPRLEKLYTANGVGKRVGLIPGYSVSGLAKKDYSSLQIYNEPLWPVYLLTCAEVEFFKAEYALQNGNETVAQTAYESAIERSFMLHNLVEESAAFLNSVDGKYRWNRTLSKEKKLEQLMIQKWATLCMVNPIEMWTEMRRTGYPKFSILDGVKILENPANYNAGELIDPVQNNLGEGGFIYRLPYPENATIRNSNTPEQPGVTAKIWWNVNK